MADRLIIEVQAGQHHGVVDERYTRRFTLSDDELAVADAEDEAGTHGHPPHWAASMLIAFTAAQADEYARLVRNPYIVNWVRTDWFWLAT